MYILEPLFCFWPTVWEQQIWLQWSFHSCFTAPGRRPGTGGSQQECELLPCAGTAWKWMSFILSFENWIPWVVIESAVRPMGLSSSAWIFLSSHTQEIKEALDHSLPLLVIAASRRGSTSDVNHFSREGSLQRPGSLRINSCAVVESLLTSWALWCYPLFD